MACVNIFVTYLFTKKEVEISTANHGVIMAESIAKSIDIDSYKRFLQNRERNQDYWAIRTYLNDAREKTGALIVYTLEIDNPRVSKVMIGGFPEENPEAYEIGMECTVPPKQVKRAYQGKTYFTDLIKDPLYGDYVSAGAPIKDHSGEIIGYVGVDISTDMLKRIEATVIKSNLPNFVFSGLFVFILLITFYLVQKWYQNELKKELGETEETYHSEIQSLITSVRSLRHDFANHIQVVDGLLKIGKHQDASDYLASLRKEIHHVNDHPISLKVDHPALLVLLQTKWLSGQNQNIPITFDISQDDFSFIKNIDLIKILSNLIDNAIEATSNLPESERKITITCQVNGDHYLFEVTNTGPDIEVSDKDILFRSGYSTKGRKEGKGRGQGLFIVKEVVEDYKGRISVKSSSGITTFTVKLPFKENTK